MKPPPTLTCPACRQPMAVQKLIDWPVAVCSACHGVWLLETTLNKIVRVKRDLADPPAGAAASPFLTAMREPLRTRPHPALSCPQCGKPLRTQIYRGSGVPVDQCYPCLSLFLDAGELQLIYEFTHSTKRAAKKAEIEMLLAEHTRNMINMIHDQRRESSW
ncbi:MAG TPA: zf-TFIIB domain-containing protein [Planctomycetota bacterium]|nr:zf-TFIIB domain-containing protein [Planctomycetota bacterium]